jgi:hypothetical protein
MRDAERHSGGRDAAAAISRREAVRRASLLVGGAATLPGLLAACERGGGGAAAGAAGAAGAAPGGAWAPKALSAGQAQMVATIGEIIIPATTTPGARAAQVEQFVDNMVGGFMPKKPRERFLAGLERVDARSRRAFGKPFLDAAPDEQRRLVVAMNDAAYASATVGEARPADEGFGDGGDVGGRRGGRGARGARPAPQEGEETSASAPAGGGAAAKAATEGPGGAWDPADVGRDSFFINLKRLVIEGYYTSRVGATQELRVNPMGAWRADVPYPGQAWA